MSGMQAETFGLALECTDGYMLSDEPQTILMPRGPFALDLSHLLPSGLGA